MYAIGLMSGTSLDGIDAVLCDIENYGTNTKVKQIEFETYELKESTRKKIKKCCLNENVSTALICSLNFELGYEFGNAVLNLCKKANISTQEIKFIASHGQTIYHIPKPNGEYYASTLQIGEAAVIAQMCKCPVISNFRVMDIACGGEGAPLVPYSEFILYGSKEKNVALQNIGGIGNVTVLPNTNDIDDVFAFDTGPGNMIINEAMNILYGQQYDDKGKIALSGTMVESLKNELMEHPYLNQTIPKTTGREMFGEDFTKDILSRYQNEKKEDLIHTLTWFTAYSIAYNYNQFIFPKYPISEVILAGGGVHNLTLIEMIKQLLPEVNVLTQEDKGYSSDAKEAIAFVILGNETWNHHYSNVPNATGAKEKAILGNITLSY